MKKLIAIAFVFSLLLSLAGCGSTASEVAETDATESTQVEELDAEETEDEEESSAAEELDPQEDQYLEALSLAQDGNYIEAVAALREISDYKDSAVLSKEFAYAAVRDYIKENGEPFSLEAEEFQDSFDSYEYAVTVPYNEVASVVMALDESENVVFSLVNEAGERTDSGSLGYYLGECFNMTLVEDMNTADFMTMSVVTLGGAYTLEWGIGELDITTHTLSTALTLKEGYKKTRTISGDETELENATIDDMTSTSTMLESTVNERLLSTVEDTLGEMGLSLYDLGFAAMPPYSPAGDAGGSAEGSTDTTVSTGGSVSGEAIDLTLETGRAVFKDWSYLPDGFLADDSYDPSNAILVNFDYTNLEDTAKSMQSDFWVRAYQNGVELENSFCSYYPDVLETVDNLWTNVLNGGTVTVGWWFYLSDRSPVTIIINQNGGTIEQRMVIELE